MVCSPIYENVTVLFVSISVGLMSVWVLVLCSVSVLRCQYNFPIDVKQLMWKSDFFFYWIKITLFVLSLCFTNHFGLWKIKSEFEQQHQQHKNEIKKKRSRKNATKNRNISNSDMTDVVACVHIGDNYAYGNWFKCSSYRLNRTPKPWNPSGFPISRMVRSTTHCKHATTANLLIRSSISSTSCCKYLLKQHIAISRCFWNFRDRPTKKK